MGKNHVWLGDDPHAPAPECRHSSVKVAHLQVDQGRRRSPLQQEPDTTYIKKQESRGFEQGPWLGVQQRRVEGGRALQILGVLGHLNKSQGVLQSWVGPSAPAIMAATAGHRQGLHRSPDFARVAHAGYCQEHAFIIQIMDPRSTCRRPADPCFRCYRPGRARTRRHCLRGLLHGVAIPRRSSHRLDGLPRMAGPVCVVADRRSHLDRRGACWNAAEGCHRPNGGVALRHSGADQPRGFAARIPCVGCVVGARGP